MNRELILSLNLKPTLVKACKELGFQTSETKAEFVDRLILNKAKLEEVGVLLSKEQLDPEDLNDTFLSGDSDVTVKNSDVNVKSDDVADKNESIGKAKLVIYSK
uniref:SAP domain-containing protein n=1 Tax=Strongyloides venezuelensis TaxID=75913 RepID=A0A0K0FEE2_STRVS